MVSDLEGVSSTHYGQRVLLYLLAPRSSRHFSSQFVGILSVGDDNAHSKKLPDVRRQELQEGVVPALLSLATSHMKDWVQSKTYVMLLLEAMLCRHSNSLPLQQALVDALCCEGGVVMMSDVHTDWVLGHVLQFESAPCDEGLSCAATGMGTTSCCACIN